ncbi:MAG TPA: CoA transferase [Kineosporiaceae bacterium]
MSPLPALGNDLVRHGLLPVGQLPWSGPRRWWGGRLDVEGLALAAVSLAAAAVNEFTGVPGRVTATADRVAAAFDSLGQLRIRGHRPQGFAPLSGFFATADGWIRTHANYPHHEQRLTLALRADTPTGVAAAVAELRALQAEEVICSAGGIAAAVRTPTDWARSAMGSATVADRWIDLEPAPVPDGSDTRGAPRYAGASRRDGDAPLSGVRVLDLTRVVAGPTASRSLAALGADVLRIDPPATPELWDHHVDTGFGKRTTVLDLGRPENAATAHTLLTPADVVLVGYRPGSLDRFGLSPGALRERYPHLVVVTLDAWGDRGPWAGRRGFDSIVQAAVGIADVYRHDDGRPGALPVQALDHATGYGMAAAAVSLLTARKTRGVTGTAHLSRARTGQLLLAAPVPADSVEPLPEPALSATSSAYGDLLHARPPFDLDGVPLRYPHPPHRYGSDPASWW